MLSTASAAQFIKYLITGLSSFAVEYGLYVLFYKVLAVHYVTASAIVYTIVFGLVFILNRNWSFQSNGDIRRQLLRYTLLFFFNLFAANVVIMYLLTDIWGLSPYLSPIIKMGVVVCWNFLIYKYIIYK